MVGGFATSDYLFSKLEEHFKLRGIDILRPDAYLWAKKNVALRIHELIVLVSGTKQSQRVL